MNLQRVARAASPCFDHPTELQMSSITPKSHVEIALASINVFLNDGTLDIGELNFLLGLALRDQQIDAEEARVLNNIFKQAQKGALAPAVLARIEEVKLKHKLGD
jgi:hypothetical protein